MEERAARRLGKEEEAMNKWQSIETAPMDGSAFQAKIPGHGTDNVIAWCDGYLDSKGDDCCCWAFVSDQEPPDNWTDGVCWDVNEDGVPSTKPTHWKPLSSSAARSASGSPTNKSNNR